MKKLLIVINLIFLGRNLLAQDVSQNFLKVGDTIPDISFVVSNYHDHTLKLSDFGDKLVILDIWGVNCGGCIKAMPKMQMLQDEFLEKIQILMVTKDSRQAVDKLIQKSEIVKSIRLPFITGEEPLADLFDYTFVPTYVWISNNVVRYITDQALVNQDDIDNLLKGREFDVTEKKDVIPESSNPLMVELYPFLGKNMLIYSYLAPKKSDNYRIGGSSGKSLHDGKIKVYSTSATLTDLYKIAYGWKILWRDDRVLVQFDKGESVVPDFKTRENIYVYEAIADASISEDSFFTYIQQQLDLLFGIDSNLERRNIQCFILKNIDSRKNERIFTKKEGKTEVIGQLAKFRSVPWQWVVNHLNSTEIGAPIEIVDETSFESNRLVSFDMNIDFKNLESINKNLNQYGITLEEDKRELEVIILNQR